MLFTRIALALSATLMLAPAAFANDSSAVIGAGGIELVTTESVSMDSEDLYISPSKVTVDYVFTNQSDKDIETLVAFPMPDIRYFGEEVTDVPNENSNNFMNFKVSQDGEPITVTLEQRAFVHNIDVTEALEKKGIPLLPTAKVTAKALAEKITPDDIDDWVARGMISKMSWSEGEEEKVEYQPAWTLKSTYWWRTVFPAGQPVKVHHIYKPSVGGTVDTAFLDMDNKPSEQMAFYKERYCLTDGFVKLAVAAKTKAKKSTYWMEKWLSYILVTGNNWYGPIGTFHLTVDKEDPQNLVSFCSEGVKKTGPTTFEMTQKDFYPQKNLDVLIVYPQVVEQ